MALSSFNNQEEEDEKVGDDDEVEAAKMGAINEEKKG